MARTYAEVLAARKTRSNETEMKFKVEVGDAVIQSAEVDGIIVFHDNFSGKSMYVDLQEHDMPTWVFLSGWMGLETLMDESNHPFVVKVRKLMTLEQERNGIAPDEGWIP